MSKTDRKKAVRILSVIVAALVLAIAAYNIGKSLYSPYETEIAYEYTQKTTCDLSGVIIRNERIVTNSGGIVNYLIDDAGKVAAGGVIAEVYSSTQAAQDQMKIRELERKIEILERSQEAGADASVYTEMLASEIGNIYRNIVLASTTNDVSAIKAYKEDLQICLNKLSITTQQSENFDGKIKEYKAQMQAIKNSSSMSVKNIVSDVSGYFVSSVDGYEDICSFENIDDITLSDVRNIMSSNNTKQDRDESVIGKIVEGYTWYYAAPITKENADKFVEGRELTIKFSSAYVDEIPATVERVKVDKESGEGLVIFSCDTMSKGLAALRTHSAQTTFRVAKGLRVSKSAVRIEDGVKGVYVKVGKVIYYRPITVIYEGDNYVVCDMSDSENKLKLYDEVVTKGKDLYHGKSVG